MLAPNVIERRIRLAAGLVLVGIAVEAVTLTILHPLSFLAFAFFGVLCMVLGIVIFLLTLLQAGEAPAA